MALAVPDPMRMARDTTAPVAAKVTDVTLDISGHAVAGAATRSSPAAGQ
jgi:hypothetical protein